MKHGLRAGLAVLAIVVLGVILWRAFGPHADDQDLLTGYVEGDQLYLSSPVAGTVGQIMVAKGQRVEAGAQLFAMDPATLNAQQGQAAARTEQARAQVGAAQSQAAQAQASLAAARAGEVQARKDLARYLGLQRSNPQAVAAQQVDAARAQADSATAQRQAAERAAAAQAVQVVAARAAVQQAGAAQTETGVRLGQLSGRAPSAGRVEDVFFQPGEWAAANQPVVALLPDSQIKLRFYVPEQDVQLYRIGRAVEFACDGCRGRLSARIDYVSPRPEFTPPIIYSRKTRDKLVFLVEARPADASGLTPGLPVDVIPAPGGHKAPR
jgi:HlyD family secretion protein